MNEWQARVIASSKLQNGLYQGYSGDTTTEQAERAFTAKYGYKPRTVVKRPGGVLAGPIREEQTEAV